MAVGAVPVPARLGRYEIQSRLAFGGMAEIFVARLRGSDGFAKQVAIKRVLPELARERELVELFIAEARVAATLDHQNIVHVHDIGQDDGSYFFAMELLHGADVGSLLATVTRFGGELPIAIAVEIVRAAATGLHYAHERRSPDGALLGLVHRDVSPQNLFVTFEGAVKVLDFGIAKMVEQMSPATRTRTGALRGKIRYMSPEQCRGEPLDRRSDVFNLAIVLWELTVGEPLYGGDDNSELAILKSIAEQDAPRPSTRRPGYWPELEVIVMRGLARDRDARYATADALAHDLERLAREKSWWTGARELAAFMTGAFPDRAKAWQASTAEPGQARVTTPLPSTAPAAVPATAAAEPPQPKPATVPARNATAVSNVEPRPMRWVALAIAGIAIASLALAIGFVLGRSRSSAPMPRPVAQPGGEDAHWFQPDDVLASKKPFNGERLDWLMVAKPLGGNKYIDGNGRDLVTEYTWRTRVATREDLAIGTPAFCQAPEYLDHAKVPPDRAYARKEPWMLGRVTDIAQIANGEIMVANVTCELAGVRVVATP